MGWSEVCVHKERTEGGRERKEDRVCTGFFSLPSVTMEIRFYMLLFIIH
jgi:hypothetical protein